MSETRHETKQDEGWTKKDQQQEPEPSRYANRALDALVAEKVMGMRRYGAIRYGERCVVLVKEHNDCWRYTRTQRDPGTWEPTSEPVTTDGFPYYSTVLDAAWLVVERLRELRKGEREMREVFALAHCYTAKQVAAAICRAALQAVEAE